MVYFIQQGSNGPIKIGQAFNPEVRLKEMQISNPYPLYLLGCTRDSGSTKQDYHQEFKHLNMRGEWFRPADELLVFIRKVCPKYREKKPDIFNSNQNNEQGGLLTVAELAELLQVPKSWVYSRSRMTGDNAMPKIKVGKYCRFELSAVIEWIKEKNITP